MAVSAFAAGTQLATVTTEHFLSSPNVLGRFQLQVDLVNMAAGDVLELRVYKMVVTSGTARVVYEAQFAGAQPTDALIAISEAIGNALTDTNAVRFSLKQTFGTGRNFPWTVLNLEDGTEVTAIKATTDQFAFTVANQVNSNVLDWKSATAPAMTGDAFARLGAPAGASVSADIAAILTTALIESYNADGVSPTAAQALLLSLQRLTEFAIAGTTITIKKLDGSTTAATLTIDDATNPTSSTRAT